MARSTLRCEKTTLEKSFRESLENVKNGVDIELDYLAQFASWDGFNEWLNSIASKTPSKSIRLINAAYHSKRQSIVYNYDISVPDLTEFINDLKTESKTGLKNVPEVNNSLLERGTLSKVIESKTEDISNDVRPSSAVVSGLPEKTFKGADNKLSDPEKMSTELFKEIEKQLLHQLGDQDLATTECKTEENISHWFNHISKKPGAEKLIDNNGEIKQSDISTKSKKSSKIVRKKSGETTFLDDDDKMDEGVRNIEEETKGKKGKKGKKRKKEKNNRKGKNKSAEKAEQIDTNPLPRSLIDPELLELFNQWDQFVRYKKEYEDNMTVEKHSRETQVAVSPLQIVIKDYSLGKHYKKQFTLINTSKEWLQCTRTALASDDHYFKVRGNVVSRIAPGGFQDYQVHFCSEEYRSCEAKITFLIKRSDQSVTECSIHLTYLPAAIDQVKQEEPIFLISECAGE